MVTQLINIVGKSLVIIGLFFFISCENNAVKTKSNSAIFPIKDSTNLFGYIDAVGNIIIPPQYQYATYFTNKLAVVAVDTMYGYIDTAGQWSIPPIYSYAEPFFNGFATVRLKDSLGNEKEYIITKDGKHIFENMYKKPLTFYRDRAVINDNGKSYIIDTLGQCIKSFDNSLLNNFEDRNAVLKHDTGIVLITRWGMVENPDLHFQDIDYFRDDLARCKVNNQFAFINTEFEIQFILPKNYRFVSAFSQGYASFSKPVEKRILIGFINKKGIEVINAKFASTKPFSESLAAVQVSNNASNKKTWGFIDKKGNWVIRPQFDNVWDSFCHGLAIVKVDNHWGYINKKGEWVKKNEFGEIWQDIVRTERFNYLSNIPCDCRF